MKFILPLPPNLANGRMHWAAKNRKRRVYMLTCRAWKIPRRPVEPLTRARIRATLFVFNRMDRDNLTARLKWPVDFLVQRGYILDDSEDVLEWAGLPSQQIDRRHQRVEIELEPL